MVLRLHPDKDRKFTSNSAEAFTAISCAYVLKDASSRIEYDPAQDGNTHEGAVPIDGSNGSTALGSSITISSGMCMTTSSESVTILTSNAGTAGMLGYLLLSTGTVSIGNSGTLDVGSGSSASGLGGSIAIPVGSGTNIGGAFSVMAGDLSGAAGRDASIVSVDQALEGDETTNFKFPLITKSGYRVEVLLNAMS